MSNSITKQLYKKQNGKCFYCKQQMLPFVDNAGASPKAHSQPLYPTYEHIKLNSNGGNKRMSNGVCSCFMCNQLRGIICHDAFRLIVTSRESQLLLISDQPSVTVTVGGVSKVIGDISNIVYSWVQTVLQPSVPDVYQLSKTKYQYSVNNFVKINNALSRQNGACVCGKMLIQPKTVSKEAYFASKQRPTLRPKTNSIQCYKC